jgi:hypothetical protein
MKKAFAILSEANNMLTELISLVMAIVFAVAISYIASCI